MSGSLITFVLVLHSLIAVALVAVILMQRSEGGALGIGGGPGGLMTARGAGNFLSKSTGWLAATFLGTSIFLAILAARGTDPAAIDTTLAPTAAAPFIADEVEGDDPTDPALATPTQDLDDVPFAFPDTNAAEDAEIPDAR